MYLVQAKHGCARGGQGDVQLRHTIHCCAKPCQGRPGTAEDGQERPGTARDGHVKGPPLVYSFGQLYTRRGPLTWPSLAVPERPWPKNDGNNKAGEDARREKARKRTQGALVRREAAKKSQLGFRQSYFFGTDLAQPFFKFLKT